MAKPPVDLELKRAFTGLQKKTIETTQILKMCDLQIRRLQIEKRAQIKVFGEINELSQDSVVYESIGRAFVYSDISESIVDIKNEMKHVDEKIAAIEERKKAVQNGVKECERNLREMVAKKKLNLGK